MKEIPKLKTILNAFTEALPEGEPWYEERLAICRACPHNSLNCKNKSVLNAFKDIIHVGQSYCTLCGCFDDRKCSRKEEECSLVEHGEEPKWKKLAIHTVGDDLNVEINKGNGSISLERNGNDTYFQYDYGVVNKTKDMNVSFKVFNAKPFHLSDISFGCHLCTEGNFYEENGYYIVNAKIKLEAIPRGIFKKSVYLKYNIGKESFRACIKLKGNHR